MAWLWEKNSEENGNIIGVKAIKVHPIEGVTWEVSFTSEVTGEGRYPSGENLGSGTLTKYPHGVIDANWQNSLTIADGRPTNL